MPHPLTSQTPGSFQFRNAARGQKSAQTGGLWLWLWLWKTKMNRGEGRPENNGRKQKAVLLMDSAIFPSMHSFPIFSAFSYWPPLFTIHIRAISIFQTCMRDMHVCWTDPRTGGYIRYGAVPYAQHAKYTRISPIWLVLPHRYK